MKRLATFAALASLVALPAAADTSVSYICDLNGLDGMLDLDIAGQVARSADGHPTSLVAARPALAFSGELTSEMAGYTLSGRGTSGTLTDLASDETYEVGFSAEGADLLVSIDPDTPGQTVYRCRKS